MKLEVGKRVLYRTQGESRVREGIVGEASPSGKYQLMGYEWHNAAEVTVLEELTAIEPPEKTPLTPSPSPQGEGGAASQGSTGAASDGSRGATNPTSPDVGTN